LPKDNFQKNNVKIVLRLTKAAETSHLSHG